MTRSDLEMHVSDNRRGWLRMARALVRSDGHLADTTKEALGTRHSQTDLVEQKL